MSNRFINVSMNGRMAYTIMCVESYVSHKYPDRDWSSISNVLWRATSENWADWSDLYSTFIPDVFLGYEKYDEDELAEYMTENEFCKMKTLYMGITDGIEDDPKDELNYMLNKPFEMAMVYEGTVVGTATDSLAIIFEAEHILDKNGIEYPDSSKLQFSKISERNGWGEDFDGRFLSVILNK